MIGVRGAPPGSAGAIGARARRVVLAAAVSAIAAGAAGAAELRLPPDAGAPPGTTTVVSVSIDDASGILGADLVLTYDAGVARPTGVFLTTLSASQTLTFNEASPGVLKVSIYGIDALAGSGPLLDVVFESVGPAGSSTELHFGSADLNEGAIAAALVDGSYCVSGTPAEATSLMVGLQPGTTIATLSWGEQPGASAYNVYRASQYGTADLACFIPGVRYPPTPDTGEVPPRGGIFFFLVTAVGCGGESIPGRRSDGTPIPNPDSCGP